MKHAASAMYVVLAIVVGVLVISSLSANRGVDFSWRPEHVAFTFIPMMVFVVIALFLQIGAPVSWFLLGQTLLVGISLLVAAHFHLMPEKCVVAASFHLFFVALFVALNVVRLLRRLG